jgi:hypothetical protein
MSYRVLALALSFLAGVAVAGSRAHAQVPEGLSSSEWSSIRGAYEEGRHRVFERADGTHEARTHGQQYATTFDGPRAVVASDGGDWSFSLELVRYGFDGHVVEVDEPRRNHVEGQRIAYVWDDVVTEWYVNRAGGLEHGFTVSARPEGAGDGSELRFDLRVLGDLVPSVDANGLGVALVADGGVRVASYAGLVVTDAHGHALAARMTTTGDALSILVDESAAAYPLTIDPTIQQAYLKASNTDAGDRFGASVAISGDTVVVGAPNEDSAATGVGGDESSNSASNSGAAYVFTRNGAFWSQQAYLKASNTGANDTFGGAVAIDGDTVVVGALREDSSATGVGGDESNNSGNGSGAVYVFTRSGATWTQQAYLKASNTGNGDGFGSSVAIDGDTVAVGAWVEASSATGVNGNQADNSAPSAGAVYVFTRNGASWAQQAYLKASNTGSGDRFGTKVAIDGDTVVVGARREDSSAVGVNGNEADESAADSGAAYVFTRSGTTWTQQAYLKASNTQTDDVFGTSVDVDGDTVVVGATRESSNATGVNGNQADESAPSAGAVYVFERTGATWSQQAYLKASNTDPDDAFGSGVAIDGNLLIVGASSEDSNSTFVDGNEFDNSSIDAGAAYVFARNGSVWVQANYLKSEGVSPSDLFGDVVALDGTTVVVGVGNEDGSGTGVNGNPWDNFTDASGAAYVFEFEPTWTIVPGCHGNTAAYAVPSAPARIGTTVPISLFGSAVSGGIVATYFGATGVDALGCGLVLAPNEELLLALAPSPTFHSFAVMTGGLATIPLTVPNNPSIVGFVVTLQSAAIDATTFASEFSNGLEFVIRP